MMPGTAMERAGQRHNLRMAREIYADRTYQDDGTLTPRKQAGAVLHDAEEAARRVLAMVREHPVLDGRDLSVAAAGTRRSRGDDGPTIVAVDCGMKEGILQGLAGSGMRVEVVPAGTTADEILALGPDGVIVAFASVMSSMRRRTVGPTFSVEMR